jgi:WD40 repeat protein
VKKSVTSVDVLSGGRLACSAGFDNVVRFWDLETGVLSSSLGCGAGVLCVRLDGAQRAVWGCNDGSLRVGDLRQKSEPLVVAAHNEPVTAVALGKRGGRWPFSTGDLMCSASVDGSVKLWDLRMTSKSCYSTLLTAPEESLLAVDLDGSVVACAGKGRTLYLFDVASEEPIRQLRQHHSDWIHGVALGTERIFTCSRDKTVKILTSAKAGGGGGGVVAVAAGLSPVVKPRAASARSFLTMFTSSEKSEKSE